ncbi:DNA repair protein RecN [Gloeothece citriformis PCC 7424]|uniref:DNA repair protein RecN n=1 Tax=Gloeothece citriformis (strain PCC 7424) TaxID=65393 RepID=B7KBG4_GLOC7|nr:DNA repair protein RecN [Gloeothece citriformis]ACK71520.1 DNA repair protein RecN [Gloeothece citriformis PCC 7424]
MLSVLRIQNFTLIDQLELEFGTKLNVLTGETGAGKSIILDAIDVVLGGKANYRLIRQGTQQAMIEATFHLNPNLSLWLSQQQIDPLDDGTLVCTRELTLSSNSIRSRSRINGVLVNLSLINQLREHLVEITAQGQTVQLMDSAIQRELLDLYGGQPILTQRQKVVSVYEIAKTAHQTLEKRRQSEQQRLQRLDLLQYQLKELEEVKLTDPDELEQLEQERDRLSHVVDLQQLSYRVYQLLYQNDSGDLAIADLLADAESLLTNMAEYDNEINSVLEMVKTALTQIIEAGQQINAYGDGLEADPERLTEVEERILILKRICRKYGPTLPEVIAHYEKLQQELSELTDSEQSIEQLEKDYQIAQEKLIKTCEDLSELRQQAAEKLEKQLIKELKPLAMDKVIFACKIFPCTPGVTGADQIIFYFSPNPGEKIQPLSHTASGGEMSRFLLALKACFSQTDNPSHTLIFDEIDAGVSGKVAQAIAEKLHQLSEKHQILCVTHQPLVAAMADAHFRVEKEMIEDYSKQEDSQNGQLNFPEIRTVVRVRKLNNHQTRRDELALLTGGHSADEAIAFADSLLLKATAYRLGKS